MLPRPAPLTLQDWVAAVNQAEAEFWKLSSGTRVGWSDEILGFDCGGQQWVLEVSLEGLQACAGLCGGWGCRHAGPQGACAWVCRARQQILPAVVKLGSGIATSAPVGGQCQWGGALPATPPCCCGASRVLPAAILHAALPHLTNEGCHGEGPTKFVFLYGDVSMPNHVASQSPSPLPASPNPSPHPSAALRPQAALPVGKLNDLKGTTKDIDFMEALLKEIKSNKVRIVPNSHAHTMACPASHRPLYQKPLLLPCLSVSWFL